MLSQFTLVAILTCSILLLCVLVFSPQAFLRSSMPLPHTAEYNDIPVQEAIARLRADPTQDVIFAQSEGFWDDESRWQTVADAYHDYFEKKKAELKAVLGTSTFEGNWTTEAYPVFAVGEDIIVWGTGTEALYLRCYQEDQETGFEVSLLSATSPNSNHRPVSIYAELRKLTFL